MWALLFFFALVDGNSGGAANCNAKVVPSMGGTNASNGWTVTASPSAFAAGTPISVTINGPAGVLKGLSLYTEGGSGTIYGTWNAATNFKANINCANSAGVTHTNGNEKALPLTFVWNPPATNPGVATLTIRALSLYTSSPYMWAIVSTTITNNFSATTTAPTPATTTAPTGAPSAAATGAPSNAVTSAPTTLTPTSSAPTFGACMDGIKGPGEIAVDCGGPCPPCANYTWVPDAWTPCSMPCGGGIQTRVVRCVDGTTGNTTDPSNCASLHPAETSTTCNPDPCANYSWNVGPWSACSSACNTGTQTRSVTCMSSIGNSTVQDVNCGAVTKPVTDQSCNTDPCSQARWVSQPWGLCSATCGGGSQTRAVECQNTSNAVVMDTDCMGTTKPDTQQICGNNTCEVYVWNPCPTFYPCTASCYGGTGMLGVRYKDVFCVAISTLQAVDASLCDIGTKPVTNYSSCNPNRCTGFNWMANANWGPCEATSGQFVRTRSFHCHAADGSVALNTACQSVPLPVSSLPCKPNTCLKNVPEIVSSASFTAASLLTAALVFLSQ